MREMVMRGYIGLLLSLIVLQGSAIAGVLPPFPPDDAVVLKRCPAAQAALDAISANTSKSINEAKIAKSKTEGLAIACRAAMDLVVNTEKVVSALKECRAQGVIDAQPLISRMEKAVLESRSAAKELESMQAVCHQQP